MNSNGGRYGTPTPVHIYDILANITEETGQASAVLNTLGVFEMVDIIISRLPILEAINAPQVSTMWEGVVAGSPAIRKGCFFADPKQGLVNMTAIFAAENDPQRNEALAIVASKLGIYVLPQITVKMPDREATPALIYDMLLQKGNTVVILNPLIHRVCRLADTQSRINLCKVAETTNKLMPSPKWTKMFLTQPPVTSVDMQQIAGGSTNTLGLINFDGGWRIENPSGVTIKDLMEWIEFHRNTGHHSQWGPDWYPVFAGLVPSEPEWTDAV